VHHDSADFFAKYLRQNHTILFIPPLLTIPHNNFSPVILLCNSLQLAKISILFRLDDIPINLQQISLVYFMMD
jgi:hypothetical protein